MQKTLLALVILALHSAFGCSDIFINQGGYHVEGRTMDFPINMAIKDFIGFIGQTNTTDVVIDAKDIPSTQLTSWANKYGFFGRTAFQAEKIVDGMNTEGFSVAILYLPGTKFPAYNANDNRPVLAVYDLGNYLLAQVATVSEAIQLLQAHQIVQSAIDMGNGEYITNIPVHLVMRDKTGKSAVVEYPDGQFKLYANAGDVLTNEPTFDWQLNNASFYESLSLKNKKPNAKFKKRVYQYDAIYAADFRHSTANLLGMPGDFTPASRFARARVLLNNFAKPTSSNAALYQASCVIASMCTPFSGAGTTTIWSVIKDLDNGVIYIREYGFHQGVGEFYPMPITNGYSAIDLKGINFNQVPEGYPFTGIKPSDPANVKKILNASDLPAFGG